MIHGLNFSSKFEDIWEWSWKWRAMYPQIGEKKKKEKFFLKFQMTENFREYVNIRCVIN